MDKGDIEMTKTNKHNIENVDLGLFQKWKDENYGIKLDDPKGDIQDSIERFEAKNRDTFECDVNLVQQTRRRSWVVGRELVRP